jgi:hypothetical protein
MTKHITTKQMVKDRQDEYKSYGWTMMTLDSIARKMCGCYDWQGIIPQLEGWSLQKRALQKLVDEYAYGWIVNESEYGDGTSLYYVTWSQERFINRK